MLSGLRVLTLEFEATYERRTASAAVPSVSGDADADTFAAESSRDFSFFDSGGDPSDPPDFSFFDEENSVRRQSAEQPRRPSLHNCKGEKEDDSRSKGKKIE